MDFLFILFTIAFTVFMLWIFNSLYLIFFGEHLYDVKNTVNYFYQKIIMFFNSLKKLNIGN